MKKNKQKKILPIIPFAAIYLAVIAVCIVSDQLTKHFLEEPLKGGRTIRILGDWLTLHWTYNDGGAFGGLQNANILFFVMTLIGLPIFCYMLWRSRTRSVWGQVGFAFIAGGTVGNAIDRAVILTEGEFFGGRVRDFISVKGFAIFNVADSFLVVGVIMAILAIMFFDYDAVFRKTPAAEEENSAEEEQDVTPPEDDGRHDD